MSDPGQFIIDKGGLTVYGIGIESRHDQLQELIEMLRFCQEVERSGMARLIKSVWYDSNGAHAEIEPSDAFHAQDEITQWAAIECIRQIAQQTLEVSVFLDLWTWGLNARAMKSRQHLSLLSGGSQ